MVAEDLVLIPEDIIVDVVLLGRLRRQDEGLHEPSHGLAVVGQLPGDLDHHPGPQRGVRIHLLDFGVAIAEIERHDLLVDFELTHGGRLLLARLLDAAMCESGVLAVESVEMEGGLVQQGVILPHELAADLLRAGC